MSEKIVSSSSVKLASAANVPSMLNQIRPQWQAKNLIERVKRLIDVDPSSACQRLFNAAVHDLRDKVVVAGVDIAEEAAKQYKLPPVKVNEDIENYPTAKLIDLSHRMGLLSRPEWRRISRCYEIRRDLEHEDDEYEAGLQDCVYIFKSCIDVILSRDPVQLVRVTDFKELIEQASLIVPDRTLLEDYENAPIPRQEEIFKFLISHALDKQKPDLVQQNSYACISYIRGISRHTVLVSVGDYLQKKAGRSFDDRMARVAHISGAFPYLRQSARCTFFENIFDEMQKVGSTWSSYEHHGELLRSFKDYGGLENCPKEIRNSILIWLVLTYIGEKGGQTSYGNIRNVFYSNTAAPIIREIINASANLIREELLDLADNREIKRAITNEHISRRFEKLLDLVDN